MEKLLLNLLLLTLGLVNIGSANPLDKLSESPAFATEVVTDGSVTERGDDEPIPTTELYEFPTPKTFLDEPESYQTYPDTIKRPSISYIPPNFDLTKIFDITGTKTDNGSRARYVGRAKCQCGKPGPTRIVGGEPAKINEYPWTAALLRKSWLGTVSNSAYCGGTLINNRYVVTASHCVDGMTASGIVVVLHEQDFYSQTETTEGVQKFDVERITMHPNYNRRNIDNDVALLKLSKPVKLDQVIVPVCLPANNDYTFENVTATAAGWGATSEGGSVSNVLRKVDVPIISNDDCNTKTNYQGKITDNMLCAGSIEQGGMDSCQGDSGGPLIIENGGRRTLVGVVSWGYGCARPKSPGVYTRVARYPEWILQNTKGSDWCED